MAKIDVNVPDIGDFKDVPIIEVLVKPGDVVKVDQSLVTLESDKATMDVPSPVAGAVVEVAAKVGDKVSMGVLIARIDAAEADAAAPSASAAPAETRAPSAPQAPPPAPQGPPPALAAQTVARAPPAEAAAGPAKADFSGVFAGPAVRRLARELGLDLNLIKGTGEKGRITREDVRRRSSRIPAAPVRLLAAGARCRRSQPSTSPSSGRSRPFRCRASSAFPGRACMRHG